MYELDSSSVIMFSILITTVLENIYITKRNFMLIKRLMLGDLSCCSMQLALVPCKVIIVFLLLSRLFTLPSILFKLFFFHSFFRLFANFSKLESK